MKFVDFQVKYFLNNTKTYLSQHKEYCISTYILKKCHKQLTIIESKLAGVVIDNRKT